MNSLSLAVLDERAGRPTGNPFKVRCVTQKYVTQGIFDIGTGLSIKLAQDMDFCIRPLLGHAYVLGHRVDNEAGELVLTVLVKPHCRLNEGDEIAQVTIVEQSVKPVRFVEITDKGWRVITGGPREVSDG